MGGYTSSIGRGRFHAATDDTVLSPRGRSGRRLVVLCHALGQTGAAFAGAATSLKMTWLAQQLASQGLTLAASGFAGDNWGNAAGTAEVEEMRLAAGTYGCLTDKVVLIGFSHGHATAWGYRRDYPSRVAAIAGVIPACDLQDFRVNNRATARASIDTAHGVVYPAALPAGANPAENTATLAGPPAKLYYSTGDEVCIPATVTAFASGVGASTSVIGSGAHTDAVVAGVDPADLAAFCIANGA